MTAAKEIVLVIPDIHLPFEHKDAFAFLEAVRNKYKPTKVVSLGDEVDYHALSQFDTDPDGDGPGPEHRKAMIGMRKLYKLFPECQVVHSNHTSRPFRKAFSAGIPALFMKSYAEFFEAPPGWSWHSEVEVDGVLFCHGEGCSGPTGALKRAERRMQSTVIGHLHTDAGILWNANSKHLIFGMNCGCLIDHKAYAFAYAKHIDKKPILGCGIIGYGIPFYVPLNLMANGRWRGHL